jgi:hypothetical protein
MTIPSNREYLDSGDGSGCRVRGLARQVINGEGTTKQLTVSESGALCVFGNAAGQIYALPAIGANDVGMFFDFTVTVTATSNGYSVDTDSASTFIGGGILEVDDGGGGTESFLGDIAAHVSIDLDSTETGEDPGGLFTLTCISATEWACGGFTVGSGTLATPFA